ncbi:MAG: immunoglobulin domain-containing protein, partial [Limisphaerales bacterium]
MKRIFLVCVAGLAAVLSAAPVSAQILMSSGTYSQNFDSLANSGSANDWTDNFTLPGWYASKSAAPNAIATYRANDGAGITGALYSYGATASSNRALGCLVSGTPGNIAFGLRFTNDTAFAQSNILISFMGEQWRNANALAQTLAFSYQIGTLLANSDGAGELTWNSFSTLNFTTPVTGGSSTALDGTAVANQIVFTNVLLAGVAVQPGQELFLRWFLARPASGSSHGVAIDNLTISFQATAASTNPPIITSQPQSQAAGESGFAIFSASATGNPPPDFQWQFNGTNLVGQTNSTLALNNINSDQAGNYSVIVINSAGATNSKVATLMVAPTALPAINGAITILTYNVAGNNTDTETDPSAWSTNAPQVQAIGRELMYLKPDIITFNEIPTTNGVAQMTNWITAFLPGYFLATNSYGDGYIQNVIASRFPITRSASRLHNLNLEQYGYTNSNFTRDLFEAQIAVPNWPLPLHVFVAHLKSTDSSTPQDDANKRAAEASAVSNYFASVFLNGTNATHPYVLCGDMNEDAFFPDTDYTSGHPIQRLTGAPTGLQMTIPVNPVTHTDLTESIQYSLDTRFDYILPCPLLFSNIAGSEVFRTDLLNPLPPDLF